MNASSDAKEGPAALLTTEVTPGASADALDFDLILGQWVFRGGLRVVAGDEQPHIGELTLTLTLNPNP